jgi:hypothetical protein
MVDATLAALLADNVDHHAGPSPATTIVWTLVPATVLAARRCARSRRP